MRSVEDELFGALSSRASSVCRSSLDVQLLLERQGGRIPIWIRPPASVVGATDLHRFLQSFIASNRTHRRAILSRSTVPGQEVFVEH